MTSHSGLAALSILALLGCKPLLTSLPDAVGTEGQPFSYQITATNNPTQRTATVPPPKGLTVNAATGEIAGTPTESGEFPATMTATNASGSDTKPLLIRIQAPSHQVDAEKELLIRNATVVQDPQRTQLGGPWHFRTVMQNLAGTGANVDTFAENWFKTWESDIVVNGDTARKRTGPAQPVLPAAALRDAWANNRFRLIAIVNRMDLTRFQDNNGEEPTAMGEGRFIFEVLGTAGTPLRFTIIVEFGLPADPNNLKKEVESWARRWHALGRPSLGGPGVFSPAYLAELQKITDAYSAHGNLNQLRTNEFLNSPWELREFKFDSAGPQLKLGTVAQTPAFSKNGLPELTAFVNGSQAAILAGTHQVPAAMLGAFSPVQVPWSVPNTDARAKFIFSFNTCSGCHRFDTPGTPFQHVFGSQVGVQASLSGFLSGEQTLAEALPPADNVKKTHNEMAERATLLGKMAKDLQPEPGDISRILSGRARRAH